jgi:DNA ligase D-like protein (predicted ligase)
MPLPDFIPPMLAEYGEAFDSEEFLFEVKWDGTRAMAFVDASSSVRLINRRKVLLNDRYTDLSFLGDLPPGTVIDGEIVVLKNGKPEFQSLQSREQARSPLYVKSLARHEPATFIAFDLLYRDFESVCGQTLESRREQLKQIIDGHPHGHLLMSEGVVGTGKAFFDACCEQGLEGMMAKRLNSRYAPGQRNGAWIKVKQCNHMLCAIIGFVQKDQDKDFRTLLIATEQDGQAVYIGRVASGVDEAMRGKLNALLWPLVRETPVVACRERARWVEPEVYCKVRYLEKTSGGQLRSPVIEEVCDGD